MACVCRGGGRHRENDRLCEWLCARVSRADLKMDRLEKKIKFCKSVGDEERVDRLMKVYINMH